MTLLLRMDDRMNRQLSSTVVKEDHAMALAEELVHYGFINEVLSSQLLFNVLRSIYHKSSLLIPNFFL